MKYLVIFLLFASCQTGAIITTEKGKCVKLDSTYAYFEIEYNCKMAYPCVKTAYTDNNSKYEIGKTYKLTQILK